jgi:hypothetical protein
VSGDPDGSTPETELQDSTPNAGGPERAAGGMGVSSERVGSTGPGQEATDGERDTRVAGTSGAPEIDESETPPEQSSGRHEQNPDGIEPRADYPSKDPRSD